MLMRNFKVAILIMIQMDLYIITNKQKSFTLINEKK